MFTLFLMGGLLTCIYFYLGDITSQGLVNKKRKLYEEVTQCVEQSSAARTTESPSSIATSLSNSSVHSALNKLFNKRHTAGGKGGRCKTKDLKKLSACSATTTSSSKADTIRTSPSTKEKPVTVALVDNSEAMTVPKDKTKL